MDQIASDLQFQGGVELPVVSQFDRSGEVGDIHYLDDPSINDIIHDKVGPIT